MACQSVIRSITEWLCADVATPSEDFIKDWIFTASAAITHVAEQEQAHPRMFACTLVGAVATPRLSVYFQVGDGGVVVDEGEGFRPVFWPEETEAVNLSYFITDEKWWKHVQIRVSDRCPQEMSLFTDGLQLLVLNYADRSAHSPFFSGLLLQIKNCPADRTSQLNEALRAYLASDIINARTDDDKTLVLATTMAVEGVN